MDDTESMGITTSDLFDYTLLKVETSNEYVEEELLEEDVQMMVYFLLNLQIKNLI